MEKKKIFYNSPEAAQYRTNIEGWVCSNGRFWGKNEDSARYSGSTHKYCDCGKETEKYYTKCSSCRGDYKRKKYLMMPYQEYDGTPTLLWDDGEKFFHDEQDLWDYYEGFDEEDRPSEVSLIVCKKAYLPLIDYISVVENSDITPEDWEGKLPKEVENKVKELNDTIKKQGVFSWVEGIYRTSFNFTK